MGEFKGQGHIVHPVSNRSTSFIVHINRTNHSWDLGKTHPTFLKTIWQTKSFQQNSSNIESCDKHDKWNIATRFCSNTLRGCHFILQTSKFLFINVTAVTLCQGHQNVIQYVFPDLYFLCSKYLRFSWNGFDVRSKSLCGDGRGRGGGNELKT